MGKKSRTDTRAQTDMPEWVQPPEVNAKCDVVINFFWHPERHTHKQGKTYTSSLRRL